MGSKNLRQTQIEQALRPVLTARGLDQPAFAVVIPVVCAAGGVYLLLEVRAAGISQAGDPCFPGGKIEPGEAPAQAAARELHEELGILADPKGFLGQLPTVQTYLGRNTDVFVCTVSEQSAAAVRTSPSEVAEVLRVPLAFFLKTPAASSFPFGGHNIWGMTAGAIRHFCAAWEKAGLPKQVI